MGNHETVPLEGVGLDRPIDCYRCTAFAPFQPHPTKIWMRCRIRFPSPRRSEGSRERGSSRRKHCSEFVRAQFVGPSHEPERRALFGQTVRRLYRAEQCSALLPQNGSGIQGANLGWEKSLPGSNAGRKLRLGRRCGKAIENAASSLAIKRVLRFANAADIRRRGWIRGN